MRFLEKVILRHHINVIILLVVVFVLNHGNGCLKEGVPRQDVPFCGGKELCAELSEEQLKMLIKKADSGDICSLRELGYRYSQGIGVPFNEVKAGEIYKKLANSGDSLGMIIVGNCYSSGDGGYPLDFYKALEWYEKAFDKNPVKISMLICRLYMTGAEGFPVDKLKASEYVALMEASVKQAEDVDDLLFVAQGFELGVYVPRDYQKAMFYYHEAAAKGSVEAMLSLVRNYYEGIVVEADPLEARKWLDEVMRLSSNNEKGSAKEIKKTECSSCR